MGTIPPVVLESPASQNILLNALPILLLIVLIVILIITIRSFVTLGQVRVMNEDMMKKSFYAVILALLAFLSYPLVVSICQLIDGGDDMELTVDFIRLGVHVLYGYVIWLVVSKRKCLLTLALFNLLLVLPLSVLSTCLSLFAETKVWFSHFLKYSIVTAVMSILIAAFCLREKQLSKSENKAERAPSDTV